MRFVCEWCLEKIAIRHSGSPYNEVLAHINACGRRSADMTLKQLAGLAELIATLVVEQDEFTCPSCGDAIHVNIGSWPAIQRQVLDHLDACGELQTLGISPTLLRLMSHSIAEQFSEDRLRRGRKG